MKSTDGKVVELKIADIRMDGGTQPRAELDQSVIADYADAMTEGAEFPPVTVFYDGENRWLADGFHRVNAAIENDFRTIPADVRQGTRRDGVLHSVGANAIHGMRRTNRDKRQAVETLLRDKEWGKNSASWIAEACGVSIDFASRLKNEHNRLSLNESQLVTGRDGRTIDTTNIGKSKPKATRELVDEETGEVLEAEVTPATPEKLAVKRDQDGARRTKEAKQRLELEERMSAEFRQAFQSLWNEMAQARRDKWEGPTTHEAACKCVAQLNGLVAQA